MSMNKAKKDLVFVILVLCVMLSACSSKKENKNTKIITEEDIKSTDSYQVKEQSKEDDSAHFLKDSLQKDILRYVDAYGEWHTMQINKNIQMHTYDYENLKNDASGINYEDETYTIRKGIDVSHHQGKINWKKVKAAGYEFAFLRIAYRGYGQKGTLNLDKEFINNIKEARKADIDVGVYLFSQAINEQEAIEEAQIVIDNLKDFSIQLPVVFDPELIKEDEARTDHVTGEQFTKNTIAFCNKIKEAGYETAIYSNMCWEADLFDLEQLSDYSIWYADYEKIPQTPYHFEYWQYSEEGVVDGVDGKVDLDIQFIKKR